MTGWSSVCSFLHSECPKLEHGRLTTMMCLIEGRKGKGSKWNTNQYKLESSKISHKIERPYTGPCGERNGKPLQCFCLENPRDRGAWWAAVYGVAQSRTRLKRLSSSRSSSSNIHLWLKKIKESCELSFIWGSTGDSTSNCCSVALLCPDSLQPSRLQHIRLSWPSLSPGVCSNPCPLD